MNNTKGKTIRIIFAIILAILLYIVAGGGKEVVKESMEQHIEKPIRTVALQEEEFLPIQEYRVVPKKVVVAQIEAPKSNVKVVATRSTPTRGNLIGTFEFTAYCPCTKCCGANAKGITASGTKVQANRTIAVDPKMIPLGSKVHIEGYGDYIAEDRGGAIKGNKIDMFFYTHQEALNFGRKKGIKVYWR